VCRSRAENGAMASTDGATAALLRASMRNYS